ncbi:hypothetical protein ACOQFL_13720 [Actinopolyspora sp. H202]|uniref:hypothetical protein n=1 Tax=Actinopolyspora sp. H202 TaxID=1500456 RepID=UPI003EE799F2
MIFKYVHRSDILPCSVGAIIGVVIFLVPFSIYTMSNSGGESSISVTGKYAPVAPQSSWSDVTIKELDLSSQPENIDSCRSAARWIRDQPGYASTSGDVLQTTFRTSRKTIVKIVDVSLSQEEINYADTGVSPARAVCLPGRDSASDSHIFHENRSAKITLGDWGSRVVPCFLRSKKECGLYDLEGYEFPLSPGEPKEIEFYLYLAPKVHAIRWSIKMDLLVNGEEQRVVLDNDSRDFITAKDGMILGNEYLMYYEWCGLESPSRIILRESSKYSPCLA